MGGVVSSIFGGDQADASRGAADAQLQATRESIKFQEEALDKQLDFLTESRDIARGDLEPFREVGSTDLSTLGSLVTDPQAQADFITNNPFFDALAEKSTQTLLNNAAARGKVGSGGTAEALQNSILLLGNDLLNQDVTRRQNLATLGSNAAAGQATTTQNTANALSAATQNSANAVSDLTIQGGNAQAAGLVGAANARADATNNLISTGITALALCDARAKENIEHVGYTSKGFPLYSFNYIGDDQFQVNVLAQDVEIVMPEAVYEINGYKHVDMEAVYGAN